jgi:hypothetical protein
MGINLQQFATQEWVQRSLIRFFKIDGTANPSSAMSNVLYFILHAIVGSRPYTTPVVYSTFATPTTTPPLRWIVFMFAVCSVHIFPFSYLAYYAMYLRPFSFANACAIQVLIAPATLAPTSPGG